MTLLLLSSVSLSALLPSPSLPLFTSSSSLFKSPLHLLFSFPPFLCSFIFQSSLPFPFAFNKSLPLLLLLVSFYFPSLPPFPLLSSSPIPVLLLSVILVVSFLPVFFVYVPLAFSFLACNSFPHPRLFLVFHLFFLSHTLSFSLAPFPRSRHLLFPFFILLSLSFFSVFFFSFPTSSSSFSPLSSLAIRLSFSLFLSSMTSSPWVAMSRRHKSKCDWIFFRAFFCVYKPPRTLIEIYIQPLFSLNCYCLQYSLTKIFSDNH